MQTIWLKQTQTSPHTFYVRPEDLPFNFSSFFIKAIHTMLNGGYGANCDRCTLTLEASPEGLVTTENGALGTMTPAYLTDTT